MATQPQSTLTRADINRQNAQHSTGPRTAEGKQRVKTNALKHGLTAKDIYFAEGESERYEILLRRLLAKWKPGTEEETDLVLTLRDAQWRADSIPALYINLTTLSTTEHLDQFPEFEDNKALQSCAAQAAGFRANARLFDQLGRHEGRFHRIQKESERRLRELISERVERERETGQIKPIPTAPQLVVAAKQTQPANPGSAKQTQPAPKPTLDDLIYGPDANNARRYNDPARAFIPPSR